MRIDRSEHTYDEHGNLLRQALVLSEEGIVEDWRLGIDRLIPWEDVARVTWRRHGLAEIVTRRGTIKLDEHVDSLRELVAEAARYVAERGLHQSALTPEGRCRRLGVPPDRALVIDETKNHLALAWGAGSVAAVLWVAVLATGGLPLVTAAVTGSAIALAAVLIPPRIIRARGDTIEVARGSASEAFEWGQLSGVTSSEGTYTLRFGNRSLGAGSGQDGTKQLVATAQAVLDARRLGYEPLEEEPTPDTALSPAAAPEPGLRGGLSRAEERMSGEADAAEQSVSGG